MTKTVLVSRQLKDDSPILNWCESQDVKLTTQSFISISPVLNLKIPTSDWIFFVSPKGAETYLSHYPILAEKVAALGPATEKVLVDKQIKVDFVGDEQLSPPKVANAFVRETNKTDRVFFPLSQRSQKSVSRKVKRSRKVLEFITYQTTLKPVVFAHNFDYMLFTSPSNFEGFIQLNQVDRATTLIAIGNTTAQCIRDKGYGDQLKVAEENTENGMLAVLKESMTMR